MFEGMIEPGHLLLILLIALIVFGPKKLPELGKGLGKGIREFKDSMSGASEKMMNEVGVTPEDARKFGESLQSVRSAANLKSTLTNVIGQTVLQPTGLQAPPPSGTAPTEGAVPAETPAAKSDTPTV
ncbi:MAG TPA: twin-arginine translocase TatA/TatE family subunit [Vicinamibacterales bacterium]|nr:twin-arginine translocase TatA/TatE family subunit [Vicinamibacterales bacterium]